MRTLEVAIIGVCASLYAIVGILTNLGIVSPVVGVVRFWPSVVVPAVFAVLFGPLVGGTGAAIGIFISDMVHPGHGIALLSLTVGVPSNFAAFYLIGYISRKNLNWRKTALGLAAGCILIGLIVYLMIKFPMLLPANAAIIFIVVFVGSYALIVMVGLFLPEWRSYGVASVIGLGVGSAIIGFGLWAYSQFLPLPLALGWERYAPFYASFLWFVWTFSTEIPFLITIVPPILKACYRAFPSLKPVEKQG